MRDQKERPGNILRAKLKAYQMPPGEAHYAHVPLAIRPLYAAFWCSTEVVNGGSTQLFFNTTGIVLPEAVEGFRLVGLPDVGDVVTRAIAFFSPPYPRGAEERRTRLGIETIDDWKVPPELESLDDEFYALLPLGKYRFEQAADEYVQRMG